MLCERISYRLLDEKMLNIKIPSITLNILTYTYADKAHIIHIRTVGENGSSESMIILSNYRVWPDKYQHYPCLANWVIFPAF